MSRNPYVPRMSNGWWLKKPFYTRYMMRELSSFFVGTYTALLVVGLWRLSEGPERWQSWVDFMVSPAVVVYQLLALAFTLYHTVTWFAVTPRTTPIMKGEDFVPPGPIVAAQYVAWVAVSIVVLVAAAI